MPAHPPTAPVAESAAVDPEAEAKQKQREIDDKIYDAYRESLVKVEQETAKEYDKWILTLAGVLLGFSLTLVKDFIRPNGATMQQPWCLYTAWGALALPLALGLLNLQLSYSATKKYRSIVDTQYEKYDQLTDFWGETRKMMMCVWRNRFVETFNWVSLISFFVGIGFLVAFVYHNVEGDKHEQGQVQRAERLQQAQRAETESAKRAEQSEAEHHAATADEGGATQGSLNRDASYTARPHQGAATNPTTQQKG